MEGGDTMYNVYYMDPETNELGRLLLEGIDDISEYVNRDNCFITLNAVYMKKCFVK